MHPLPELNNVLSVCRPSTPNVNGKDHSSRARNGNGCACQKAACWKSGVTKPVVLPRTFEVLPDTCWVLDNFRNKVAFELLLAVLNTPNVTKKAVLRNQKKCDANSVGGFARKLVKPAWARWLCHRTDSTLRRTLRQSQPDRQLRRLRDTLFDHRAWQALCLHRCDSSRTNSQMLYGRCATHHVRPEI